MDNEPLSLALRDSRDVGTGIVWVKAGLLHLCVHVSGIWTNIWCVGGFSSWRGSGAWLSWFGHSTLAICWTSVVSSSFGEVTPEPGEGGEERIDGGRFQSDAFQYVIVR